MPLKRIDRPDCEKAYSFEIAVCDDPGCGLHLFPEQPHTVRRSARSSSGGISCAMC